ncbi:MAG: MBL fold metallo-hydrolase [Flavobacteriaceae bacterium]
MIRVKQLFIFLLCLNITVVFSQDDDVNDVKNGKTDTYVPTYPVAAIKVTDSIYMLKGKGGNIGLCLGKDGTFMIDDQFADGSSAILNTVSRLTLKPVQFLVNTHFHGDHTGGNKNMIDAGVVIFSQENVRNRLLAEIRGKAEDSLQKIFEMNKEKFMKDGAVEEKAIEGAKRASGIVEDLMSKDNPLPMITFAEDLTFYYNGEKIVVFHVHNAHTDGDSMVYFTQSNVLHTGDAFVNGQYPFIDLMNGGSFDGYLNGLSKILMMANEETKIIPGHGDVASLEDVKYTKSMLEFLTSRVAYHYMDRKSLEQVLAMKELTKEFDDKGFGNGFISTQKLITAIYKDTEAKYGNKGGKN